MFRAQTKNKDGNMRLPFLVLKTNSNAQYLTLNSLIGIILHMIKPNAFVDYLTNKFPDAVCELKFKSTFQLLIAVILSAQCTDKRVNMVTDTLFKKYSSPKDFAQIPQDVLEQKIKSCGFYHNKAKNIIACAKGILEKYDGEVPRNFDDLITLAGVGRKTANVVCAVAYGENRCAVDTHVLRVSNRLGFAKTDNPDVCERELTKRFKTGLDKLHYRMVLFGRYHCKAIKPNCMECDIKDECKYYKTKH